MLRWTISRKSGARSTRAQPQESLREWQQRFSRQSTGEKHATFRNFDSVFTVFARILLNLGRDAECDALLAKYEATVKTKDSRYINYCDLECYRYWVTGNFQKAIEWGQRGKDLKGIVDTQYSTELHLALAQRDAGIIDPALEYFLEGRPLADVIDPEELDDERGGAYYGNIGRCLHLMGQIDPAIVCYRKSAILLQKEAGHNENQGFARKWIGELLVSRGEFCVAKAFLEAAKQKWEMVGPPRIPEIEARLASIQMLTSDCDTLVARDIERYCLAWIFGREADFVAS